MSKPNDGKVRFIRVRGRIIPVRARKEVDAAGAIARGAASLAGVSIVGGIAAGMGAQYAAGRVERAAFALNSTYKLKALSKAGVLNRLAKTLKFGGKYGAAAFVGTQITKIDLGTRADERSQLFNLGGGATMPGAGHKPNYLGMAVGLGAAFAFGRVGKRFEKWGLRGGKFPWQLRDI